MEITGTRQRLDAARNGLSPDTGSSIYRFSEKDIENLPLGNATPMNQVILRSPGVVQDSYGQLHIRGDHANVQYRIDGVIIPESISGFGQSLETRFANSINVLTGALPAQYGYRTAGIVDITTKGESTEGNGGRITVVGGSRGHAETDLELGGSTGAFSYYLTGSYLHDDVGIENPTAASRALHDETEPEQGLRLSLVPARHRQPRQSPLRHLEQPLPDSRRAGAGAQLHARPDACRSTRPRSMRPSASATASPC